MKESATADPRSARTQARAMAGTRVEAMPTVPASASVGLPEGVAAASMLWEETLGAGGYASKELARAPACGSSTRTAMPVCRCWRSMPSDRVSA